ncbi:MAG: hypothetical protein V4674_03835 [Patescibacteria group bacterium]
MTFSKIIAGAGAFTAGFALAAGAAFAQTATTGGAGTPDYTEGTYYYYYNGQTGSSQSSADPADTNGAAANTSLNVNGQNTDPNDNSYLYYYTTAGAAANTSANSTGLNQGVNAENTTATPGLPNTGVGGDAREIILALALSALAFTVGGVALTKAA